MLHFSLVTRSYRYRLVPTAAQTRALFAWLAATRELYNAALEERRDAWRKQRISVSCFDQMTQLPAVRAERLDLAAVPVVVLRGALRRLDRAFGAFFRRCKTGEKPGFPRFKGRGHWASLLLDDLGKRSPIVAGGNRVAVPLLGKVKFKQHRPIEGTPKALRLTVDAGGRWFVTFACVNVSAKPLPKSSAVVGVDLGLLHFAATSDGQTFENPRPLTVARLRLEQAARRLSRRKRGSKRRRIARVLLAKAHAHVANVRRENAITVARNLVARYQTIYVEDLNIKGLARSVLAKSVNDAAWGTFLHWLRCKAESAGREVVEVDPRGTSQECSQCGCIVEKSLVVRVHSCPHCGLVIDRDVNAAINIKARGQRVQGAALPVRRRRRSVKPHDRVTA